MGFADVEKTPMSRDGGIDVRGTLIVGDVVRIRMAVQAKRWKQDVGPAIVRELRGAMGPDEHGLVITTSEFTKGAQDEATRANARSVALMDGKQLADLLAWYQIGVKRKEHALFVLDSPESEHR